LAQQFDTPINTNDQSIDRVLAAGIPVALIFLKGKSPEDLKQTMQRLAKDHAGELLIAQIQIEENQLSYQRFAAGQAPALVTIRKGQIMTKADRVSASEFEKHVLHLLGKGPRPENHQPSPHKNVTQNGDQKRDGQPHPVSDATFDHEVLGANRPVLVDFWAPWCGPCRMTDPILEKLARELSAGLLVAKVNVDENPILSQKYSVQSIPTMMIFKNGQIVDRWVGALPEAVIRGRVSVHIK
jgi:thioredoxin 1